MKEFHYRVSARQGFVLYDKGGIKAGLEIAGIKLPYPKSSVYVPGKPYTFRSPLRSAHVPLDT
jgi:hypothetical protein